MSWLQKANVKVGQVVSTQEAIQNVTSGVWNLAQGIEVLRRMVSGDDPTVCQEIQAQYVAAQSSSAQNKQQILRSLDTLAREVCSDVQPPVQDGSLNQNQPPPVENADMPESEEFV